MSCGYAHKILTVDLTRGECSIQRTDPQEDSFRKYLGGTGLAAKYLYEELRPEADPLGPDNVLIFMTGPFCGTPVPCSGRHTVVAKSPLTGFWGESDCGGDWGVMLKKAGFDGIVIRGQAKEPVYLWITHGKGEVRQAKHLWGMDTYDIYDAVREETDAGAEIASIGPAGERLVRFSAIMTAGRDGRASGRTGMGAVMGSKRLKAIAVHGAGKNEIYDKKSLSASLRDVVPNVVKGTAGLSNFGTSAGIVNIERLGDLPLKNWQQGNWPGAENISGMKLAETYLTGKYRCASCPVRCGRVVAVSEGKYSPVNGAGPEYETVAVLGALLLIDDLAAVCMANELCNRYGLDTLSTGGVIAFALEAYERGFLDKDHTGGLELKWGNPDVMLQLIRLIAGRQGIGGLLAEGVKIASEKLDPKCKDFAIHVKGLEPSMHDPRAHNGLAVLYAVSSVGASHNQGMTHNFEKVLTCPEMGLTKPMDRFAVEGKGIFTAKTEDFMSICDSLKICKFVLFGGVSLTNMCQWLNAVTGWDVSLEELIKTGERITNLKRLHNIRFGLKEQDDGLPRRLTGEKRRTGGAADNLPDVNTMLKEYYEYRGWSQAGVPLPEKIKELGLESFGKNV
jgi:aldehyde:ferredoxin oxidoreductase